MEYQIRQVIKKLLNECDPLHYEIAVMFSKGNRPENESTDYYWNEIVCVWANQFTENK